MSRKNGRYLLPSPDDVIPLEMEIPILANWLCTDCGTRIWESDANIHDAWHDGLRETLEQLATRSST